MPERFARLAQDFEAPQPVVLSNEGLSGTVQIPEAISGSSAGEASDARSIARRLHLLAKDIQIIFVIREQRSSIESYYFSYAQVCVSGSENPHRDREAYPDVPLDFTEWYWQNTDYFMRNRSYHEIIEIWMEVFGLENVKVFLYEELKKSPENYVREIREHIGVDPEIGIGVAAGEKRRTRLTRREFALKTVVTRIFPSWHRWKVVRLTANRLLPLFRGTEKLSVSFSSAVEEDIRITCSPGNAALNAMFDLQLEKHGYFVNDNSDPSNSRSAAVRGY